MFSIPVLVTVELGIGFNVASATGFDLFRFSQS
jgi:chorismate synthase